MAADAGAMMNAAIGLALGLLLAVTHLTLLRANAEYFVASGSWRKASILCLARLALSGCVLWLTVQIGAVALIAALAGFLFARSAILARLVFAHG